MSWSAVANLTGPQGPQGIQGPQGDPGPTGNTGSTGSTGPAGADGKTVRSGSGAPAGGLGVDGDFYINIAANTIYGPKTGGAWGSPVSLVGPQGTAGTNGTNGTNGTDGKTVRSGSGAPAGGLGVDGDFYINTAANTIYGPKTGGAWGSPTSLVDPQGNTGSTGPQGPAGSAVVIATDTSPANGGTYTIAANQPTTGGPATTRRVATSVAGFILGNPTSGYDGQQIIVEITPTVSFNLTVTGPVLTTGLASPIAVAANKTLFVALRLKGSTWYVMAARASL